jgi:hypothetical protein
MMPLRMSLPGLLTFCTLATLGFGAGCRPDSQNVAGPNAQFEQETAGATQISGIGFYAGPSECNDPQGEGSTYDLIMTGDLEGCHYVFVETGVCSAGGVSGGVYRETGTETFVGAYNGTSGTFRTTYLFTGRYTDCATLTGEIVGRCQHPIVAGSGDGVFEGVTGRLDMKDDIENGNFPYRGHFRWATRDLRASSSAAFSSGTLAAPGSLPGC